jgi:diguanylate cyclase (GGDEF)-like protein
MSIRILIVDDEPYNLDILRIYFKSKNYEVYESICGEDAIKQVAEVNPDLILLDVMLPDISGYEVCKQLNGFGDFNTPIIFLSANTQKNAILQGLELGVFDYLTKPFDLELLERKVSNALQHQKNHKRELNHRLEFDIEQAKTNQQPLCFVILQVDEFEMLYASYGEAALVLLFKSITIRLKKSGITITEISRLAPDKILVILPNNSQVVTEEMEKIILILSDQPYFVEQSDIFITMSIGISLYPYDGGDVQTLIKNAEMATHSAKRSGGGNKFMFYSPEMNSSLSKRMKLEYKLRRALEKNEFSLHYQPKINIRTGNITGTEALIRWTDQELGVIPPAEFIPIAEEIGIINSIGRWVIQTACEQNKRWNDTGFHDLSVAVNLSVLQIESLDFLNSIVEILKNTGLKPNLLELEITEGVLMHNASTTLAVLNELKKMGIQISIDDFGTGYSSLGYLKKFPIDCLKIDRSFIKDIIHETDISEITNAIISLAQTLNLKVIAEGVETEEQLQYLKNKDVDEIQGYYFSKPLPSLDFEKYLINHYQHVTEKLVNQFIS